MYHIYGKHVSQECNISSSFFIFNIGLSKSNFDRWVGLEEFLFFAADEALYVGFVFVGAEDTKKNAE